MVKLKFPFDCISKYVCKCAMHTKRPMLENRPTTWEWAALKTCPPCKAFQMRLTKFCSSVRRAHFWLDRGEESAAVS